MPGKLDLNDAPNYGFYPRLAKAVAEQQQAAAALADPQGGASYLSGSYSSVNGPDYYVAENLLGAYAAIAGTVYFLSTFMGLPQYTQAYKDEVYATAKLQLQGVA